MTHFDRNGRQTPRIILCRRNDCGGGLLHARQDERTGLGALLRYAQLILVVLDFARAQSLAAGTFTADVPQGAIEARLAYETSTPGTHYYYEHSWDTDCGGGPVQLLTGTPGTFSVTLAYNGSTLVRDTGTTKPDKDDSEGVAPSIDPSGAEC